MKTATRYFCDVEGQAHDVFGCWPMKNAEFSARFPGIKGKAYDSFSCMVGSATPLIGSEILPITRFVHYKGNPSLHECNAKCKGGKCGGTCECRCGGKNHGINR